MSPRTLVVVVIAALSVVGDARAWDIPPGVWTLNQKGETLTLRCEKERQLTLDWRFKDRRRLTVSGRYAVTATKGNHTSATLRVSTIGSEVRIGGTLARRDLTEVDALDTTLRVGQKLRLTLVGGCSGKKDWLQLCLHEQRKGRPHVSCRTLYAPRKTACGPPVDGRLINPPPTRR